MEDLRNLPHPRKTGCMIIVDLNSREPLSDNEADALNNSLHWMIRERNKLDDDIRKTSQRIVLSGEAKLKAMRDGS